MRALFYYLIAIVMLLFAGCAEKSPLDVSNYSLKIPAPVQFNKSEMVVDGDYTPGYTSGNIRSDRVFLSWQANNSSDFLAYKIFRDNVPIKTLATATQTSLVDSSLISGLKYLYSIAIITKEGTSRVDTMCIQTPHILAPFNLSYTLLSSTRLKLWWINRMESASQFEIWRQAAGDTLTLLSTVSDTFFVDSSIENNQTYTYEVIAKNNFETSTGAFINIFVNYLFQTPVLTSIRQLTPELSVELLWLDNSNAETGFRIYRKDPGTSTARPIGKVGANETRYVDNLSLVLEQQYSYQVRAFNESDSTDLSNSRTITLHETVTFISEGFEASATIPNNWTTTSSSGILSNWIIDQFNANTGTHSAQSGAIGNNANTSLMTSFIATQQVNISFDYRVSSESGWDFLEFYINDVLQQRWSGEHAWQNYSIDYNASGVVNLEWRYVKDSVSSGGLDAVWIDNVLVQ